MALKRIASQHEFSAKMTGPQFFGACPETNFRAKNKCRLQVGLRCQSELQFKPNWRADSAVGV